MTLTSYNDCTNDSVIVAPYIHSAKLKLEENFQFKIGCYGQSSLENSKIRSLVCPLARQPDQMNN
jgi:hypothetical protein